nr:High temperature protein G [Candidatus Pantoea persica]
MGKPLFVRTNGRIKLTSHGERLLLSCQKAFSELSATCADICTGMRHHLNVSLRPQLLSQWLIPRIGTFYQRHPDIEVQFQSLLELAQPRSEHIDVLILSYEQPPDGDIDATLIGGDYVGPLSLCAALRLALSPSVGSCRADVAARRSPSARPGGVVEKRRCARQFLVGKTLRQSDARHSGGEKRPGRHCGAASAGAQRA